MPAYMNPAPSQLSFSPSPWALNPPTNFFIFFYLILFIFGCCIAEEQECGRYFHLRECAILSLLWCICTNAQSSTFHMGKGALGRRVTAVQCSFVKKYIWEEEDVFFWFFTLRWDLLFPSALSVTGKQGGKITLGDWLEDTFFPL